MELRNLSIQDGTPDDVVQFVKHLEENIDPDNEFDCAVTLETVTDGVQDLPGDDIPISGKEPAKAEYGVRVFVTFVDNEDAPSHRILELTKSFYGEDFSLQSSFDGGSGTYEVYVFETV